MERVGWGYYSTVNTYLKFTASLHIYVKVNEKEYYLATCRGDFGLHVSKESIIEYIFLWNDISRRDLLS